MRRKSLFYLVFSLMLVCSPYACEAAADNLEKDLVQEIQGCKTILAAAQAKVKAGGGGAAEIAKLKASAENVRADYLLLQERFQSRGNVAATLGAKAVERNNAVASGVIKAIAEYLALIDAIPPDNTASAATLDRLQTLLDALASPKKRPILGTLPYKNLGYPATEPNNASPITPAYLGGNQTVSPEDTQSTPEAPISPEIAELAKSLKWNPVLIYEWVKNNVETEWYWGSMKGAEETLHQKSGNDADQAALLVALLRASNFPTRYVRGTIQFFPDIEKAKNLTGIDDPLKIAAFFQKVGIPFKPVIAGGGIANFQIEHIWVESQIPYSNYRGAVIDDMGKVWLALDTSIKPSGYTYNTPPDILANLSLNTLRDDYLAAVQSSTPLEFLKTKSEAYLNANLPGKSYQDLLASKALTPEVLNILPSSLQFSQTAITSEYQKLPEELKQKVIFTATTSSGSQLFTITLDAGLLSNKSVTISYEPETVEDQQIIDSFGGLNNTPAYLVRLRPVLKVGGERLVVATDGLPMGTDYILSLELISPNGSEKSTSSQITGNLTVIGIVSQRSITDTKLLKEDNAETILFKEANSHIQRWNQAEDELASLLKLSVSRPLPTVVIVGGIIDVSWLLDSPHGFEWKGVFIDALLRRIETVTRSGDPSREKTFLQLSALQGSVLENRIFEDDFKVDSISTAKLLTQANGNNAVITIDKTNIDAVLATMTLDDAIKADITNAVNQNLTVRIPQAVMAYQDWTGIGYIKENLETGESGWMLSGRIAGGMTAWRVDLWPDVYAAILQNAYSEPPSFDPSTASLLQKISATDLQSGEVGKPLGQKLQVRVTDSNKVPVAGASVTFTIKAGGGSFSNSAQTVTVTTNTLGIASAQLVLGTYTKDSPTFTWKEGDAHTQQVGENIVDASLPSGISLPVPFTAYGLPGKPNHMRQTYGDRIWGTILTFGGFVSVMIEDQFGNPISNLPVEYKVGAAAPNPAPPTCSAQSVPDVKKTYLLGTEAECLKNAPSWGECGDTTQQTLVVQSDSIGTAAQVILGGVPNAIYGITATCTGSACTDPTGKPFSTTFTRYTLPFGNCYGTEDPSRGLIITHVETTDTYGKSINAGKTGSTIPLQAKLYYLREGETTKTINQNCDSGTLTCSKVVGSSQFSTDTMRPADNPLNAAAVTFDGQPGTRLDDIPGRSGVHTIDYVLKPGLNSVVAQGTGTIGINKTTMACPTTCSTEGTSLTQTAATTILVYGVDVAVDSIPPLNVDENGYLQENITISYTINPPEYKASTAFVIIYENGNPIAYIPSETGGHGTATLSRGFLLSTKRSYAAEVALNYATGVEIKSGQIPLTVVGHPFAVERDHLLSQFDDRIPTTIGGTFTDSYKVFSFTLQDPASVTVKLLDAERKDKATIISDTALSAGNFNFVVDYDLVKSAGFDPTSAPSYHLEIVATPTNGNPSYKMLYPGHMVEKTRGKMLGQTMVHDVLIQDGSLNLSRQDFAFKGRGPQLAFSRTYTNQNSDLGFKPFGEGWTHTLDMKLQPLSSQASGVDSVPQWVRDLKGRFYSDADAPKTPAVWTVVAVNGATFKKFNGSWYAERGRHGTLQEINGAFVYTAKDGTRYSYDYPTVQPTSVKSIDDRNGNRMTFSYDGKGHLDRVADAVGRSCAFRYEYVPGVYFDDNSRLMSVTCPDNVELDFTYNKQGYLETVKRGNRIETYQYQAEPGILYGEFNLVKATDVNNHSYVYEYYGLNEIPPNFATFVKAFKSQDVVKKVTYPDTNSATFQYDVQTENRRIVRDLRGNDTVYTLNYYGNPKKIEEPLGKTTLMTWSIDEGKLDNVMTSKTDPLGYLTTYEYDPQGNVTKESDPYGKYISTTWNQIYSLPLQRTDRNGNSQSWSYDDKGNLQWQTDGDGKRTDFVYYATGEVQSKTDPRRNSTSYNYDQWGNPHTVTEPEGSVTNYDYDIRGRQVAVTDPNLQKTEYAYDALDHPTKVTYPAISAYSLPDGSTNFKTISYDPVGNLISETDRVGLTLTYTYTPRNQVKTVSRNIGGVKTFDYDANGNLTSESDWKGVATTHTYDALNRRDTSTNRLKDVMSMGYDLAGNLTSVTDYEGRITTNAYDKLNRLTDTWQPALPGEERGHLQFAYYDEADPKANLKTETDAESHTSTYQYNGRYLRTKRTNALTDNYLWEYDDNGNLLKETDEEGRVTRHEYDRQNRLTFTRRSVGGVDVVVGNRYDNNGNRTHVIDPNNNDTETRYDVWNRAYKVIDPEKFETTTVLDGEGRVVKVTDGNNHLRSKVLDKRGLPLSATDAEQQTSTFTYDLNGNPETATDPKQTVTKIAYNAEDRKTIVTEAFGAPEERTSGVVLYDKMGNVLQVRDSNGNIHRTVYNALNLPWQAYDPAPFDTRFTEATYYKTGKVKTAKDRRGNTTTSEYDALNRLVKVTDPLLQTVETTYDKVGNVKTVKDKRGILAENTYDELNRLTEKRRAGLRLVTNAYDANGNLRFITDAKGNKTEQTFTGRNLLDTNIYPDNTTQQRTYDGVGNLLTLTDEEMKVTTYSYDKENRQRTVEFAGETTEKQYDAIGNLVAVIKPEGNIRAMAYDGLKRLVTVTDDQGGSNLTTRYEYDANGNLRQQYDPRNNHVEYTYDELNRKKSHIQHKGVGDLVTQFNYDEEGNLTWLKDPKGQEFTYTFDFLNRQTDAVYPAVTTSFLAIRGIHKDYDGNNNVAGITETKADSGGAIITDSTANTYDNFDRLKTSTERGLTISYDYDANGNRTNVSTAAGTTTYSFDTRNRISTATVGTDSTVYLYYPDGKKQRVSYPNGTAISNSYYPTNRVKNVTNRAGALVISAYSYEYDTNGNRTQQVELQNSKYETTTYAYDGADRLESFTVGDGTNSTTTDYTFEGYNRKTETVTENGTVTIAKTSSYDDSDWLTGIDVTDHGTAKTISYTYDNNGNTIKKTDSSQPDGDITFEYDSRNQLVQSMRGLTLLGQYDYNAQGLRVRHRASERGDVDYFYDDKAVIEERKTDGSLLAHYRYADRLLSLFSGSDTQYYHYDALGSTVNLTNASGATQISYTLDPWGHIRNQVGTSVNRMIFTGQEHDGNTGLIYFGARYYDPDTARFISQDTYLGEPGTPPSLHRYLYAYSNPTVYVDLEGYASTEDFINGAATVVANLFGDVVLGNNYLNPHVVNNKFVYDQKSYKVEFEGANPSKWLKTTTKEIDAETKFKEQSTTGALIEGALNDVTCGVSGMVTGAYEGAKRGGRTLSSLKRSFDNSLSVAEQNAASFEAGQGSISTLIFGAAVYSGYKLAKPGAVSITEESVNGEVAIVGKPIVSGGWKPSEIMPNGQVAGAGPGAALKDGAEFAGITEDVGQGVVSNEVRVTSPNSEARRAVQGEYIDPRTNQTIKTIDPLAADHIVPQRAIKQLENFDKLTPEQQSAVLNSADNFQGLPKTFNSSKGGKMPGEWTEYKGQPLHPDYVNRNQSLQPQLLEQLQKMIDQFSSTNAKR